MMIESPIRASACPIAPPSTSTLASLGVKGVLDELQQAPGVLVTTQGVTVP